jgi:hypothetical protein
MFSRVVVIKSVFISAPPKLLYGEGLHIRRLEPGTEIAFYVPNERSAVHAQTLLLP